MSPQSYAAQRGVSKAAERKAIATGRFTTLPDRAINPKRADAEWGAQTDPARERGLHANQMGTKTAAGTARSAVTKPVAQAAIRAAADTLQDARTDASPGEVTGCEVTGCGVSALRARMARNRDLPGVPPRLISG